MKSKTVDKRKKIIGFDLDGVILDHTENKIMLANKFGVQLSAADTPSEFYTAKVGPENFEKIRKFLYYDPLIGLRAPLMAGAKEGLAFIKKSGLPYCLVSRREPTTSGIAVLKFHGLWPTFFNESNAFFVKEKIDKNIKAIELGINAYIDDEPSVLATLLNVPRRFLLDTLGVFRDKSPYYTKVSSWNEFLRII